MDDGDKSNTPLNLNLAYMRDRDKSNTQYTIPLLRSRNYNQVTILLWGY